MNFDVTRQRVNDEAEQKCDYADDSLGQSYKFANVSKLTASSEHRSLKHDSACRTRLPESAIHADLFR